MSSLRIALIALHSSPLEPVGSGEAGGMTIYIRTLARELARAGDRVDLLTRRTDPDQPEAVDLEPGIRVFHLDDGVPRHLEKPDLPPRITAFREALAAGERYDVMHSQYWYSGMAALPVARERGIPHIQTFHTVAALTATLRPPGAGPQEPERFAGEEMLARESDAVIALSAAEAERLPGDRVHVIAPGVDRQLFYPGTPAGYVFMAARLRTVKGIDLAILALARIAPELRPELWIAGSGSPERIYGLEALAREHGVRLTLLGGMDRQRLAEYMRAATLVLIPSYSETFGLVAIEAAASGVPVIASRAGGLIDSVREGVSGVLVSGREPAAWAAAIHELLVDPSRRAMLGVSARKFSKEHDAARAAARVRQLYVETLNNDER